MYNATALQNVPFRFYRQKQLLPVLTVPTLDSQAGWRSRQGTPKQSPWISLLSTTENQKHNTAIDTDENQRVLSKSIHLPSHTEAAAVLLFVSSRCMHVSEVTVTTVLVQLDVHRAPHFLQNPTGTHGLLVSRICSTSLPKFNQLFHSSFSTYCLKVTTRKQTALDRVRITALA